MVRGSDRVCGRSRSMVSFATRVSKICRGPQKTSIVQSTKVALYCAVFSTTDFIPNEKGCTSMVSSEGARRKRVI